MQMRGPAPGLQRVPARGARRAAPLAHARRPLRPAPRAHRRDVRARARRRSRSFYGNGDELNLAFNFLFLHAPFDAPRRCATSIERDRASCSRAAAWPVWTGGNHDNHRFPTRWAGDDPDRRPVRAGDAAEAARHAVPLLRRRDRHARHRRARATASLDPVGDRFHGRTHGRDAERTPMQWTGRAGRGLHRRRASSRGSRSATSRCNVADQRDDPDSMLSLTRDLIGVRDAMPELRDGAYATLAAPDGRAGRGGAASARSSCCNLGDDAGDVDRRRTASIRDRDPSSARRRTRSTGALTLAPGEGAVILGVLTRLRSLHARCSARSARRNAVRRRRLVDAVQARRSSSAQALTIAVGPDVGVGDAGGAVAAARRAGPRACASVLIATFTPMSSTMREHRGAAGRAARAGSSPRPPCRARGTRRRRARRRTPTLGPAASR